MQHGTISRLADGVMGHKLSARIIGILLVFFAVTLGAIGLTVYCSWHLEGMAAAINDAGSLRMSSWKIAHQVTGLPAEGEPRQRRLAAMGEEIATLEAVQAALEQGDPRRPLFIPRDAGIPEAVGELGRQWREQLVPLADRAVAAKDPASRVVAVGAFESATASYVGKINAVVRLMEVNYARNTRLLRNLQFLLLAEAVAGALILMRFFLVAVIRPLRELQVGMLRMERGDLEARLPVLANDEFGELADGFNRMADNLKGVHSTLEERVESKTRSLADKNRELRILNDISRTLRESASADDFCRHFLERVKLTFDAAAASVRLFDSNQENLYLVCHSGLDDGALTNESTQHCTECLCRRAARADIPVVSVASELESRPLASACARAGFATVAAVPVNHNGRRLGIFNLYFSRRKVLARSDLELLQTLGQQLGMAIENARLKTREQEMAVSEERNMIARQLHDSIAQGLAFLNLQVQMLEQALEDGKSDDARATAALIHQGVQESYADVRELLQHFRARVAPLDLSAAVHSALDKFTEQSGVPGEFRAHGVGAPFGAEIETQVLYIVQEALSNIRKHARAERVRIDLWRERAGMRLAVTDDGVGFVPGTRANGGCGEHIGLQIMGERARRIGGELEIRSRRGSGTLIALSLQRSDCEKESP